MIAVGASSVRRAWSAKGFQSYGLMYLGLLSRDHNSLMQVRKKMVVETHFEHLRA